MANAFVKVFPTVPLSWMTWYGLSHGPVDKYKAGAVVHHFATQQEKVQPRNTES